MAQNLILQLQVQELQIPINYNYYFHPNVCHVCKMTDQNQMRLCPQCHLISYCSEEHRLLHREEHEHICQGIVSINTYRNMWDTRNMTSEDWLQFRKVNLILLKDMLRRELLPYEQQMFLFAKSCFNCRRQDNLIVTCTSCLSINKCVDHRHTPHEHMCLKLQECFFYDFFSSLLDKQGKMIPRELLSTDITSTTYDMRSLIHDGLHINCDIHLCTYSFYDGICSDKLSGPLTLLHGMRDANLLNPTVLPKIDFYIVHIIAGSFSDLYSLSAWEVLLHEFNPGTTLLVAMIEPHLSEGSEFLPICQTCINQNKKLQYDYHPMLYYNYAYKLHTQPDVIVIFNAEFRNDAISIQNIKALQREDCPILLTAKSGNKAYETVLKIQEVLHIDIVPVINEENKFVSHRSYRDYENDSVYFPNQHLVIYRDLLLSYDINRDSSRNGLIYY
ncbi:uncharacterized protein LOC116853102 [Odontomachus brunneus]|uniref:uncharacterized protein LOC116853102 n=1 Tax=Odontomachus brunneus TaxID=486640 RepID=UPI0013F2AE92|nr:uncharacterized protein LOC116853102 [Odontomachus brunneus]